MRQARKKHRTTIGNGPPKGNPAPRLERHKKWTGYGISD